MVIAMRVVELVEAGFGQAQCPFGMLRERLRHRCVRQVHQAEFCLICSKFFEGVVILLSCNFFFYNLSAML